MGVVKGFLTASTHDSGLYLYDILHLISTSLSKVFRIMTDKPPLLTFTKAAWRPGMLWKKTVEEALITVRIVESLGYFGDINHLCSKIF